MMHLSLELGPLSAYLDASWDALINFNPLHYTVDMRVSVGIEFDLDILFVHIQYDLHPLSASNVLTVTASRVISVQTSTSKVQILEE